LNPTSRARWFGLVLAYNQEEYIDYCIRNLAPVLDGIVVLYSARPFIAYNPSARELFKKTDRTRDILYALQKQLNGLIVCEGLWDDEESMRDAGLTIIRHEGGDVCVIVDADEFYDTCSFERLRSVVAGNWTPGNVFWSRYYNCYRRPDYVVDAPYLRLPVAAIINDDTAFINRRRPYGTRVDLPEDVAYWHMGYVLSDRRMWEKIHTFGHAHEIVSGWYEEKWLRWTPATTDLCRRQPTRWPRTVSIDVRRLPKILHGHPFVSPFLSANTADPPATALTTCETSSALPSIGALVSE